MNRFWYLFLIATVAVLCVSCGKDNPAQPDASQAGRSTQEWLQGNQSTIFPDVTAVPLDTRIFYDADVSEILQGPGDNAPQGLLWNDVWQDQSVHHWAVAVALGENSANQSSDQRDLCYRFLGARVDTHTTVMSPVFQIPMAVGQSNARFLRVAACSFSYPKPPSAPDSAWPFYTFVEVTMVYQLWDTDDLRWKVHVTRYGFRPQDFQNLQTMQSAWGPINQIIDDEVVTHGAGVIMPDVAYDPRSAGKGDLYVVFARYMDANHAFLYGQKGTRAVWPLTKYTVSWPQDDVSSILQIVTYVPPGGLEPCAFHPRIDIGEISFGQGGWQFGVVWTGVNYSVADSFQVRVSYGRVDNWPSFLDIPIITPGTASGMPTIDIGPPGTNSGAIGWTQATGQSWNEVGVQVASFHSGTQSLFIDQATQLAPKRATASPSVAISGPSETSVSYLRSNNPNSWPWEPCARLITSGATPETPVAPGLHGEYDSGSAYSNWYGMSTSLSADSDGYYWMLWSGWRSDVTQQDDGLKRVYGAYGFAE